MSEEVTEVNETTQSDEQFTEDVQPEEMPPTGGDIEQKPAVDPEVEQPESDEDEDDDDEDDDDVVYECPAEFNEREEMRKMFVGGINSETTDEEFKGLFEQYGEITDFVIIRKDDKRSDRLFGFITFKNCDDLEEALMSRPHKYEDRELDIKRAVPRGHDDRNGRYKVKKLHVGNVPKDMKAKELRRYLLARHNPKYGTIEEVDLLKEKDDPKKNKGFGFITVSTEDMADRMAIGESKFILNGTQMRISKAKPRNNEGGGGGGGRRNFGGRQNYNQQQQQNQQGQWGNEWGQYGGGGYGGYGYGAYGGGYGGPGYGGYGGAPYGNYDYNYGQYGGNYGPDKSKRGGRPAPY